MPTYPYACTACGHAFEVQQSFSDPSLTECPECEGRLRKVFSSVGVVFKGSGFYRNDSRKSASAGSTAATGAASGSEGGSTATKGATSAKGSDSSSSGSTSGSSSGSTSGSSSTSKPAASSAPAAGG